MDKQHQGSCHCGAVKFTVEVDATQGSRCNCSACTKISALTAIVKPAQFTLHSDPAKLGEYAWGGKTGTRYFCSACGVFCFLRGHLDVLGGDYVSLNLNCLDEVESRGRDGELLGRPARQLDGGLTASAVANLPSAVTRSDAFLVPDAVTYRDAAGYCCVQHPERPSFRDGNLLVLDASPAADELGAWVDRWHAAFATRPAVSHVTLRWETPGVVPPFVRGELAHAGSRLGLGLDCATVLHARSSIAPPATAAVMAPLDTDAHWAQLLELQLEGVDDGEVREFWTWRLGRLRALIASGAGTWWGAFEAGELVSTAGLFWSEEWARYQEVSTAIRARRRGLCADLCYRIGHAFLDRRPGGTLVIVADEDSPAERVYRRLGFSPASQQWTLRGERV